jgi:hypothetical protein
MQCAENFTLSPNASQCLINCTIPNCFTCNSFSTCLFCNTGYILSSDFFSCLIQCNILYCATCINFTSCSNCSEGYSLADKYCLLNCPTGTVSTGTGSNLSCNSCSTNNKFCLTCVPLSDWLTCTSCASVTYLSSSNTCVLCISVLVDCL